MVVLIDRWEPFFLGFFRLFFTNTLPLPRHLPRRHIYRNSCVESRGKHSKSNKKAYVLSQMEIQLAH